MPDQSLERRATDEDRVLAIELLRNSGPRIGLEELDRRLDAAVKAVTVGELAMLVWDLQPTPLPPPPEPPSSVWRNVGFRFHAAAYGGVNALLIGTWGLTGHGFFWPFFPIAGWGIGLGMHGIATQSHQRHKAEKSANQALKQGERAIASAQMPPAAPPNGATRREAASPASAAEAVRSSVTVMFADIVDSTRLTAVLGDEDWIKVRARCRDLLRECYRASGGSEVNSKGDGFLSRFGDARGAVRCAVEIQSRLHDQRQDIGFAPNLRIGINRGEAMDEDGDLLGTVVNVAARVMADAQPGEILTTEAVADHLDDRFNLEDRGLRTLKGMSRPLHLLSVQWKGG